MMSSSSAPSSSSGGSSFFTGFTRLCKGLAVVLVAGYALVQFLPSAVSYLALIPARTIPFAWNLITAGYIEQSLIGVAVSTVGLLFFGKLLEPLWGTREFLKFIIVVNFLTSICVFVTAIGLYYITTKESYLYTPVSGFGGVLSGFLVGLKQIIPDQELSILKIKWLPTLVILLSVAIGFFIEESGSYIPVILFGIYMSWIYLRYFQKKPETSLKGDPSDEFSFSSFFPDFLRPILDPIASIFDRALCGRSKTSQESRDDTSDAAHLPGSDSIEAMRRRERGARALEQRLAAEKLNASGRVEGSPVGDAAENV
ncbi:rhomboid-like protein 19 [Iris pallida]|uniref:Rhomboid-like protein 19 n=1 Tax=Iris pallida TaxID=29817 RepID=A0AAX6FQ64_IRIPA|nr:rhomboid-like protein 19 [Iris pallida]